MAKDTSWQDRERIKGEILRDLKENVSQKKLIEDLLKSSKQGKQSFPESAIPDGYGYVSYVAADNNAGQPGERHKKTLAFSPHPSDVSSDFAPFLIMLTKNLGGEFIQKLMTLGEKGLDDVPEEKVIAMRREEEKKASAIVGIHPEYVQTKDGGYFPDTKLMEHLPALVERIKEEIKQEKPHRIVLPSHLPDHPDHVATYIAGINAILQLRDEGFFAKNGMIEIIVLDPEFGVAAGQPWAVKEIPDVYGGSKKSNAHNSKASAIDTSLVYYDYRYSLDKKTGLVSPSEDISGKQEQAVSDIAHYPLTVPPFIVAGSDEMEKTKMNALFQHRTQMEGKSYAALIPTLDRVRGLETGQEWGMAIYPVHIPGVTVSGTPFIDALPPGSVFQLKKGNIGKMQTPQFRM